METNLSTEYVKCMLMAKASMMPYFDANKLDWDDRARLAIYKNCDLYKVTSGEVIGFFMLRLNGEKLFLADIQIEPQLRNKGYGTKILGIARDYAKKQGHCSLWLRVFKDNPALALYLREGYTVQAEEEQGYLMSADLCATSENNNI